MNLVPGFSVNGGWKGYVISALVLMLLNLLIKPVLKLLTLPLIIISLGLFGLVINGIILWLASQFTSYIVIADLVALLWATLVITVVGLLAVFK